MIVAANWKMNPAMEEASKLAMAYASQTYDGVTRILFPPHPYLVQMAMRLADSGIRVGGQDCHAATSGAHTGDVAAHMLAACGADIVLLGHSERRSDHGENDALVRAKAETALADGLSVMICVGETLQERDAGNAQKVVLSQLADSMPDDIDPQRVMVAYEPVWAIGTGKVASTEDIAAMHAVIHSWLDERGLKPVPVLYGGSVKPDNAGAIFAVPHVDGALVGGASLKLMILPPSAKPRWKCCHPNRTLEFDIDWPYNCAIANKQVLIHANAGPDHPYPDCTGADWRGAFAAFRRRWPRYWRRRWRRRWRLHEALAQQTC